MMMEGDALMTDSLAILVSRVMGFPVLLKMLMRAFCSAVSLAESGWELMNDDQLSCMVRVREGR